MQDLRGCRQSVPDKEGSTPRDTPLDSPSSSSVSNGTTIVTLCTSVLVTPCSPSSSLSVPCQSPTRESARPTRFPRPASRNTLDDDVPPSSGFFLEIRGSFGVLLLLNSGGAPRGNAVSGLRTREGQHQLQMGKREEEASNLCVQLSSGSLLDRFLRGSASDLMDSELFDRTDEGGSLQA